MHQAMKLFAFTAPLDFPICIGYNGFFLGVFDTRKTAFVSFDPAIPSKAKMLQHDLINVIMCLICTKKIKNEIQL